MTRAKKTDRYSPKFLETFEEYLTFQGYYKIPAGSGISLDKVFNKCILYITDWLIERIENNNHYDESEIMFLYDYPQQGSIGADDFDVFAQDDMVYKGANGQFDISILALKEYGEWTIRIREPNNQTEKNYPDVLFTTDVALKKTGRYVYMAVRCKCKESHHHTVKPSPYRPVFVREIIKDPDLRVTEGSLDTEDYTLDFNTLNIYTEGRSTKSDEFNFKNAIEDRRRQMPIVFCPVNTGKDGAGISIRTAKLAEHLSGMAYVVTDRNKDGYRYLLDKIGDTLRRFGETSASAKSKISDNYLIIHPSSVSDDLALLWSHLDVEGDEAFEDDVKGLEKHAREQIKDPERIVCSYFHDRNNDAEHSEFCYGDVLFYSDLWTWYIENGKDEMDEVLQETTHQIEEIENREEDPDQKVQEISAVFQTRMEQNSAKHEKAVAHLKETIRKGESEIEELNAEKKRLLKENKELTEELHKNRTDNAEIEKLRYLNSFLTRPYKKWALDKWIEEHMADNIFLHKNALDSYSDLRCPNEDILRNAFILLNAEALWRKGEMTKDVYDALRKDPLMSSFQVEPSGGDKEKCQVDGHKAEFHLTYSEHSAFMFRIYYWRDQESGLITVILIDKHV